MFCLLKVIYYSNSSRWFREMWDGLIFTPWPLTLWQTLLWRCFIFPSLIIDHRERFYTDYTDGDGTDLLLHLLNDYWLMEVKKILYFCIIRTIIIDHFCLSFGFVYAEFDVSQLLSCLLDDCNCGSTSSLSFHQVADNLFMSGAHLENFFLFLCIMTHLLNFPQQKCLALVSTIEELHSSFDQHQNKDLLYLVHQSHFHRLHVLETEVQMHETLILSSWWQLVKEYTTFSFFLESSNISTNFYQFFFQLASSIACFTVILVVLSYGAGSLQPSGLQITPWQLRFLVWRLEGIRERGMEAGRDWAFLNISDGAIRKINMRSTEMRWSLVATC